MISADSSLPGLPESGQRPVLFTDLDDTLFQTARKMAEPVCASRLVAEATNGHHSYMTVSQAAMTAWLLKATCLVPVTARSTEALSRCRIANGEEAWLDDLEGFLRILAGEHFVYHRNGNNLSFTPQGISKRAAVAHLIDIRPEIRHGIILAMGDSLTDLPFMQLANMMMIPPASQVASAIGKE